MNSATLQDQPSTNSGQKQQFQALTSGCAAFRPDRVLVSLAGRDRVRWLNSMVSNNIRDLPLGSGVYTFVLNPQGHILADLYVFNRGESFVLEIDRPQVETVLQIFRKYIIMDKVEIEDLSGKIAVIGMAGTKSLPALARFGLTGENLAPLRVAGGGWNGIEITVTSGDNPSVPSFEWWVPQENAEVAWKALLRTGALEVGEDAIETFRIACGIPKFGQDIRERILPQETGQERALNFTKGCYIGQEIVERIRSRGAVHRALTGFEIEGPAPAAGIKIQNDGKDVGEITSVTILPARDGDRVVALGYIRREHLAGKDLVAGEARVRPTPLPFAGIFGSANP